MDHLVFASLLIFLSSLANAVFVLLPRPRNLLKFLWALICLTISAEGICLFRLLTAPDAQTAYGYAFIINAAALFIPVFFFHFTLLLTNRLKQKTNELIAYYALTIAYAVVAMFYPHRFIASAGPVLSLKYYARPGDLFYFLPVLFVYLMGYGLALVYRSYRNALVIKRNQLKYFFAGCALGTIGGLSTFFPLLGVPLYPWGMYLVPVSMLTIAYAIGKYHLMDIQVVLRKSIIYTLVLSLLTMLFLVFVFAAERLFQHVVGYTSLMGSMIAVLLIALAALPVRAMVHSLIDRVFFHGSFAQIAQENVHLHEEMLALERYKTFGEIAHILREEIHGPLERMKESPVREVREEEIRNIEEVLKQLDEYSQPLVMDFKTINIVSILDDVFQGVNVVKYYQPRDVVRILGYEGQLRQAFANIVSHCAQCAQQGGDIFVTVEHDKKWAEISIRHSGRGLTPKELEGLFRPFFKTDRFKFGLDMVLAQAVVFQHGGKILVESEVDVGTEFFIELPIVFKIDRLIRSRRRSIQLSVTGDACLVVRAPHHTTLQEIDAIIRQKQAWIGRAQELLRKRHVPPKQFVEGEEFLFLGSAHPLRIVDDLPKAVVLGDALMLARVAAHNAALHIRDWYMEQALDHISARVGFYAKQEGLRYRMVKVNNARRRWGSCSYTDTLNFTWRLIMAPPRVVDYVVVHELMHLKQRNHSPRFWQEVEAVLPDYRQDERWLKDNGHRLTTL